MRGVDVGSTTSDANDLYPVGRARSTIKDIYFYSRRGRQGGSSIVRVIKEAFRFNR